MTTNKPLVSVGLPVYNGENFVAEAIESVLAQTLEDFELVISDNASTDATQEICEHYASQDSRVRYHRADVNRGAKWNFPRAFELATGKYFKWAAHDDVLAPTMLEKCVDVMENDPNVVLVMPQTTVIDKDSHRLVFTNNYFGSGCESEKQEVARQRCLSSKRASNRYKGVLLISPRLYEVFAVIRHDAMRKSGLYRGYNGAEKVFVAEMCLMGDFVEVPEELFFSRWHDARFSSNKSGAGQNQLVDPTKSNRFAMPHELRCGLAYLGLIAAARISLADRIRCLSVWTRFIARPEKWLLILSKLFTGRSNTVAIDPEWHQGDRIEIGQAAEMSTSAT